MAESFVILWTQERIRWLQRVKDFGPLEVIFGGPHISMPAIDHVSLGDCLYPVAVRGGKVFLLAGMKVQAIEPPDEFVRNRFGLERPAGCMWAEFFRWLKTKQPSVGHRIPFTCADSAAIGDQGSPFQFDRVVPPDLLEQLRFGQSSGRELPLKGFVDGQLKNNFSLQGHVRRLSQESAVWLAAML